MERPRMSLAAVFLIFCAFTLHHAHSQHVIALHEDNWREMLQDEWMVEFYAPWCPACKGLQPIWQEFATWSRDLSIKVGQVDVTVSPGLSGRFMVTALPTIFHVINGQFRQYKGTRDQNAFMNFIEDKKWRQVEPVPGWKSPNSLQMSVVSSFFKLSQVLRGIHTHLMEEYGLPTWGSYLIFAIATIILGALLGLILVCIIDLIYPPKPASVTSKEVPSGDAKKVEKISDDELADEDIKDDLLDDASQSEEEEKEAESGPETKDKDEASPTGSPTVRKRKSRKAD